MANGSVKDLADRRTDVFWLDPGLIRERTGWNPREPGKDLDDHIRELADSIKAIGVQEPLTVCMEDGVPILTNGHCRLAAVILARADGSEVLRVPVRSEDRGVSEADRTLSLITRNAGKPLTMFEQAKVVKQLLLFGWTPEEVARKTGFSVSKLQNLLCLGEASPVVIEMVKAGEVSPSNAATTIRRDGQKGGEQKIVDAVEKAKKEGRKKAVASDIDPQPTTDLYMDGYHAGMVHALALMCAEEASQKFADRAREILFPKGINTLLVAREDLEILRCYWRGL